MTVNNIPAVVTNVNKIVDTAKDVNNTELKFHPVNTLQKWMLERCLKDITFYRATAIEYFNKKYSPCYLTTELREWQISKFPKEELNVTKEMRRVYDWQHGMEHGQWVTKEVDITKVKPEFVSTRSEEANISRAYSQLKKKGLVELIHKDHKWSKVVLTEAGFNLVNNTRTCGNIVNTYQDYIAKIEELKTKEKARATSFQSAFKPISPFTRIGEKIKTVCCPDCQAKIDQLLLDIQKANDSTNL